MCHSRTIYIWISLTGRFVKNACIHSIVCVSFLYYFFSSSLLHSSKTTIDFIQFDGIDFEVKLFWSFKYKIIVGVVHQHSKYVENLSEKSIELMRWHSFVNRKSFYLFYHWTFFFIVERNKRKSSMCRNLNTSSI